MRIGVVCEGPTDFHAIESFLGEALAAAGVLTVFEAIQPALDQTQPEAGWGNVFYWLERFPPAYRIQNYFGGGLFAGQLGREKLDCLLIQMDTDILGEESFGAYVAKQYKHNVSAPSEPANRAEELRTILKLSARFEEMTNSDVSRHVLAPAVESTENWCIAAFHAVKRDFELISSSDLVREFMLALEVSESRTPQANYSNIDKDPKRRKIFCERHKSGWQRVQNGCEQFGILVSDIIRLAE